MVESPTEEGELTPQEQDLKNLYRLSFFYSQGEVGLQINYFEWMFRNGMLSQDLFSSETPPYYIAQILPPKRHVNTRKSDRNDTISEVWNEIHSLNLQAEGFHSMEDLKKRMLNQILNVDQGYLTEKPRPKRKQLKSTPPDSINDRRASMFRKYILFQHPTGHQNFNMLFEDLLFSLPDALREEPQLQKALADLERDWVNFHSNESFFPEAV